MFNLPSREEEAERSEGNRKSRAKKTPMCKKAKIVTSKPKTDAFAV